MTTARDQLMAALRAVVPDDRIGSEADLRDRLAERLGRGALTEVGVEFEPSPHDVGQPSDADRVGLPDDFVVKDPCAGNRRRVDVVVPGELVVELKWVDTERYSSDTSGRAFWLDVHRLERLARLACEGGDRAPEWPRFAVFVTNHSGYWLHRDEIERGPKEPGAFALHEGRTVSPSHLFSYEQPSPRTRWLDYPPFVIAGRYGPLAWIDFGDRWRALVVVAGVVTGYDTRG